MDIWAVDDRLSSSAPPNLEKDISEFESVTPEVTAQARKQTSQASSTSQSYKGSVQTPGLLQSGDGAVYRNGQSTLPAEKAFSIQIGWRQFKLSGASIMSDAPSYFSTYFEEQVRQEEGGNGGSKTLYIDRDPDTFADICRHLQGYYLLPRDSAHFVRLYADAQFYSLPRLISQLFESDIYTSIGGQDFQIPRNTFSGTGDGANFFSLGFSLFLGTRDNPFPGLESRGLMRPPPAPPQSVSNKSAQIFADLIHLSRGYPLTIKNEDHRTQLLGDCKYYGFKGLMHKVFAHEISHNAERGSWEIAMRLEDLHKSGISFYGDASPSDQSPLGGWVYYKRPFVDDTSYEAIVEIGNEQTKVDFRSMRAEFYGDTKARISSLFQTVADKMNLPSNMPLGLMLPSGGAAAAPASPANTPLSEDRVKIHIGADAHIVLDGQEHVMDAFPSEFQMEGDEATSPSSATAGTPNWPIPRLSPQIQQHPTSRKRRRRGSLEEFGEWIIKKGQWRMRVQQRVENQRSLMRGRIQEQGELEIVLWAVKLDAVSGQRGRNMGRRWVS